MRCAVLKPFVLKGKVQDAGTEVDLDDHLARDLIARQRARLLDKTPPAASPISTQSAPAFVAGKRGKNAQ